MKDQFFERLPNLVITDAIGSSEGGNNGLTVVTAGNTAMKSGPTVHLLGRTVVFDENLELVEPGSGVIGKIARAGDIPLGYYNDPKKTAEVFFDVRGTRYVMPGDYATVEADGSITLLGRGSIVINSGGEKIFPEEVESAVRSHPDVMDAIVCGAPDERWGQTVAAIVRAPARPRGAVARSDPGAMPGVRRRLQGPAPPLRGRRGSSARRRVSPTTRGRPRIVGAGAGAGAAGLRPDRQPGTPTHPQRSPSTREGQRLVGSAAGRIRCAESAEPWSTPKRASDARIGSDRRVAPRCRQARRRTDADRVVPPRPRLGHHVQPAAAVVEPHMDATSSWTVYHGNPLGTGADTSGVTFNPPNPAWTSAHLDGQIYGEPLEATGRVFVATENNTIYALAADTGAVLWSTHLGTPVPSGDLPCGDISPTVGITGTPVVDVARGEIFAVADELAGGVPPTSSSGSTSTPARPSWPWRVDPPGQDPAAILQRTGLNLSDGNVVFGYGGNDGDCSTYSGWVVSVPEGGGTPGYYQAVPIGHDGAVWMGGAAPEVDAAGNIWVATGNGSSSTPYDFSDSVLELSPGLARTQYFAPDTWQFDNGNDQDLGSTAPALLSDGTVLQVGKSSTAYLLNQADLGGISHPTQISACGSDADGGDADPGRWSTSRGNGVEAMQTSPCAQCAMADLERGARPADHGGRPRVVDRRLQALRPQPGQR